MQGSEVSVRLLLHTCCAPCSTWAIELLRREHDVTCLFYNPNIEPPEEYDRRLAEAERYCESAGISIVEGDYDVAAWRESVLGFEDDPEGGQRCDICFRLRLEETARQAKGQGFDAFTTTLTISPHKDADRINEIGQYISKAVGINFLSFNLKKNDGFKKSVEMSRQHGLHRQDYCGCVYSRR